MRPAFIVLCLFIAGCCCGQSDEQKARSRQADDIQKLKDTRKQEAAAALEKKCGKLHPSIEDRCRDMVRAKLFQPSSADFSGIWNSSHLMLEDCTETFISKVESKNAFGATISHNFHCTMNEKKNKPLTLDSITMS